MNWDAAKVLLDLVQFVLIGAIGIYSHIIARQRVTETQLEALKDACTRALNGLGQRLARVEESDRHSPSHDDLANVHEKLNAVAGQLHQVVGELKAMETQLKMINQHLLDKT